MNILTITYSNHIQQLAKCEESELNILYVSELYNFPHVLTLNSHNIKPKGVRIHDGLVYATYWLSLSHICAKWKVNWWWVKTKMEACHSKLCNTVWSVEYLRGQCWGWNNSQRKVQVIASEPWFRKGKTPHKLSCRRPDHMLRSHSALTPTEEPPLVPLSASSRSPAFRPTPASRAGRSCTHTAVMTNADAWGWWGLLSGGWAYSKRKVKGGLTSRWNVRTLDHV